ncbi:MAG: hypothetical protein ACOC43_06085 [Desulfohalobiaceae bacterium]
MTEQNPQILIQHYLSQNVGEMLPGLSHNLQNFVHTLKMQLELWEQRSRQAGDQMQAHTPKGLGRLQMTSQELGNFCQLMEQRSKYTALDKSPVDLEGFCCWLRDFWKNNLFFKHQVQLELYSDRISGLNLLLPPYALTMCLEEGLKNAIQACEQDNPEGDFQFKLQIEKNHQAVVLEFLAPSKLPPGLDPWERGSSNKKGHLGLGLFLVQYLCRTLNWSSSLVNHQDQSLFRLQIPSS